MICTTPKELLAEIKKYMDINDISMKELAANLDRSQQSVSQIFNNGNPNCKNLFEICDALNVKLDINFINKSGTE